MGPQCMTEQPVLLGPKMDEKENAPVDPVGQDVSSMGQGEPVDRSGPVGPQSTTEQSALLGLMTDGTENTPVCPGGPDMNSAGRGEPMDRSGPMGSQSRTKQPVLLRVHTDKRGNAPNDPVGHNVMLAGRGEMVRLDVDQVEDISANIVHPGVKMFSNQPVTDGPAGPDRTRRPAGTEWIHTERDADRPTADGPVAKLFNLDPLCPSGMPFLDELYQPLAIGPVGQPFITGPLGEHVSEPDCKRISQICSGPEGSTGVLDAVNQTGSAVQTDRLSTINGPATSGNIPPSSDLDGHSWNEQWENMSENLTYSASGQTVGSDCEGSGRVPLI